MEQKGGVPLHITYDRDADAAYIYFDPTHTRRSRRLDHVSTRTSEAGIEEIRFDYNEDNQIIGMEVLGAIGLLPQPLLDMAEDITRSRVSRPRRSKDR
jgi:uncharacterized protein YuzE